MRQRLSDFAGLTAAAILLLVPTFLVLTVVFLVSEVVLWFMLCFMQ